jgi:hypothetical protein
VNELCIAVAEEEIKLRCGKVDKIAHKLHFFKENTVVYMHMPDKMFLIVNAPFFSLALAIPFHLYF